MMTKDIPIEQEERGTVIGLSPKQVNRLKRFEEGWESPEAVFNRILDIAEMLLIGESAVGSTDEEITETSKKRLQAGELIDPLLAILLESGGSLRSSVAVSRVMRLMDDKIIESDMFVLKSGLTRISNNIQWARHRCVVQGWISKGEHGFWPLTEQGKQEAETARQRVEALGRRIADATIKGASK